MAETICESCEFVTLCRAGRDSLNGSKVKILGCSRYEKKPIKTNADRIRAMTDEELVEQFAVEMGFCCPVEGIDCSLEPDCRVCFARWLKQEAME